MINDRFTTIGSAAFQSGQTNEVTMAKQKKVNSEDKKTVALYCRVSTYEQGKGDFSSLHSQENALRKYCESKGWQVYDLYSDTKSGTSLEREGLQRLLI